MLKVIAKLKAPINTFVRNGKEETFYKPIGNMVELENGKQMLLIDKSFNLLAVQHKDNAGSVPIYMDFEEATQAPVTQNKPIKQKDKQVAEKPKKSQRPSREAVNNALKLLQQDKMLEQSEKAGHTLPFDDEIPNFNK